MLSIETPTEAESTFTPGKLQNPECFPLLFHFDWTWLKEMHQASGKQIPMDFPFDRFPGFAHPFFHSQTIVAPLPPEYRDSSKVPSPLPTHPATCAAELLTPLSQPLSEVTRYFGPNDRGVNGSFHPTQMRSCMWMLSTNYKTLLDRCERWLLNTSETQWFICTADTP